MNTAVSAISEIHFRRWRFAYKWVYFDTLTCNSASGIFNHEDFHNCVDGLRREEEELRHLVSGASKEIQYSKVVDGALTVWADGLLFCPFTGKFWCRIEPGLALWRAPHPDPNSWSDALGIAESWRCNPSFRIARHPSIRSLNPFAVAARTLKERSRRCAEHGAVHAEETEWLETLRGMPLARSTAKKFAVRSACRHVRRHSASLGEGTLNFFRMFAGAAAINKVIQCN